MNRRSFIASMGALALGQLLSGCGAQARPTLSVKFLKTSIPPQLLQEFERTLTQRAVLNFEAANQLQELFEQLKTWQQPESDSPRGWGGLALPRWGGQQSTAPADLITLGDYWLATAIRQNLIRPFNPDQLREWNRLTPPWQALVTRDRQGYVDPEGEVWGAPYRWGSTVIAYRTEAFKELGWVPQDWSDLWRPELQRRISLLNSPREVIGLTLKKLGYSYNTEALDSVSGLEAELRSLHQQVRFYSSNAYLQPLITGDTWLAVGWSTDLIPVLEENHDIAAIVPQSGTALSADVWVQPAADADSNAAQSQLMAEWIDFCWQPQIAAQLSVLSPGSSPILTGLNRQALPQALQSTPLLLPDAQVLSRSEFLLPLPEATAQAQWQLWTKIRQMD